MNAVGDSPMCVYIVDDDRDTTESMSLLFQIWGHDVHVANDGALAIEQAPRIKPDLMLVDLAMPRVDGLQVARKIRPCAELADMSLVAVSGYADAPHRQQALEAGFDEYLVKPLPADELLALISRVRMRIAASREKVVLAAAAVAASREVNARVQSSLDSSPQVPSTGVPVRVQKSGISDLVLLDDQAAAERLRHWLSGRGCRVGPVFESEPGKASFFNYSRRQFRYLLANNRDFRIDG